MASTVVGLLRLSDLPRLGLLHVEYNSCMSLERVELKSNRAHYVLTIRCVQACGLLAAGGVFLQYWIH